MHRSSVFKLKIDFDKSHNSYLFDKNSSREFLDFFGMYSTVTLGYSHPIFKERRFQEEIGRIAHLKTTNCEMQSSEAERFFQKFTTHPAMQSFRHFHFACTGALAIEAAIKIAIDQKKSKNPKVMSLKESFHGINSYGGFVTDRFPPVSQRLEAFPEMGWPKIHNPRLVSKENQIDLGATEQGVEQFKKEFVATVETCGAENVAAFLVEPIQATAGDFYFPESFFKVARELCDRYEICLIFDEIQTGFGVTGKMWYHEHTSVVPDILVFGKKAQICGVMAQEKFGEIFKRPIRLEVTWDGDLIDMVRSTYVLEAFEKYNILENVNARGRELVEGLKKIPALKNVRGLGLLAAFDFDSAEAQTQFCQKAFANGLLFNRTRDKSIRFRPNLCVTSNEIQRGLTLIRESV